MKNAIESPIQFTRLKLMNLIIPLIVEQILAATIGIAGIIMVSKVGEAAVSGISLADSFNNLLIQLFAAIATGGTIVVSQYVGNKDIDKANIAGKQLITITVGIAVIVMIFCSIFRRNILYILFGSSEMDVLNYADIYFLLSTFSFPFIAIHGTAAALFRVMGKATKTLQISLVMNVINIAGNALLIFGFKMGVMGAGLASLISRMIGALIMIWWLNNPNLTLTLKSFFPLKIQWNMIRKILGVGIPTGIESSMFQIGKILVQGFVASFGTVALAANAVGNSITFIAIMPGIAINLAVVTVVGQTIGANKPMEAKRYILKLMGYAMVMMSIINIIIFFGMDNILSLYSLSDETSRLTKQLLIIGCIGTNFIWPPSFIIPSGLRGANDVKFTMIIAVISMWVFRVGGAYVFGHVFGLGVTGIWFGMLLDWLFRAIVFGMRFCNNKWMNRKRLV